METSERSSGRCSASGLHRVSDMKRVCVAILATMVLCGCGVGADEYYDGQQLVTAKGQALESGPEEGPALPGSTGPQTPETTAPSPGGDPGQVALPQDPIPVIVGLPSPATPPMMDPLLGPAPQPPKPGLR